MFLTEGKRYVYGFTADQERVREEWLTDRRVVGISSGASAPENLVGELVDFFRARGVSDISEFDVVREDVRFMLPKPIREAASAGGVS